MKNLMLFGALLFSSSAWHLPLLAQSDLPEAFEQIVPPGAIPAVMNPQFVPADRAHLSGNNWVLGVVINGQPRAYSLNLLNRHEVVNDQIDDMPFAAVW